MNFFSFISAGLFAVILFWAVYHARILLAGIRSSRHTNHASCLNNGRDLPKFSLIVPAKDEEIVIRRCLDALLDLDYPRNRLEILVVSGVSTDATRDICVNYSEKHEEIVFVPEGEVKGKPAALNLGLSHATGDIIGVFDADSVPERNVLRRIASYFKDSSVTAVQGSAISLNETQNMLTRVAATEDKAWFQGLLHGRDKLRLFVSFTGSCQFIRSGVLKELGGWSESALAEDVELALKLVKNGGSVKYAPDVCSGQETPFSLRSLVTQRTRWYRGYMEASFRYGSLLDHVNGRVIDAELSLIGPFVMIVCLFSYINWGISTLLSPEASLLPFSAELAVLLNSVTLVSLGVSMAFFAKPAKAKNILWIPFIYGYWFLQMLIASWAFLQFSLKRRKVWGKTTKSGYVKTSFVNSGFVSSSSVLTRLSHLKVCFVSSYPPNRARLSEYAQNLVNELETRPGIAKITLLADKSTGQGVFSKIDSKVDVLRIWEQDNVVSIIRIMFHILKLRPNVVHFNVHFRSFGVGRVANFTGLSLIFLCRLLGLKVIVGIHNLGEKVDLEKMQLKPTLLNKVGILLATKFILSAPRVVVTVRSYVDYLSKRYGHMGVKFIPHGTVASSCSLVDPEEKVILMFGSMGPYKGLEVMIKAFEMLRKDKVNVRLLVGGSDHPNYSGFLNKFMKNPIPKVDFLGYVAEADLSGLFQKADVVVIPYYATTGTSGVFHLACGYGRPIVASDLPEIKELLCEGASAILFPPGDVGALKEALMKVLFNEKMALQMSEQNLRFACGESWAVVAKAYEDAYLELSEG